jgi:hypothetical protein
MQRLLLQWKVYVSYMSFNVRTFQYHVASWFHFAWKDFSWKNLEELFTINTVMSLCQQSMCAVLFQSISFSLLMLREIPDTIEIEYFNNLIVAVLKR